MVQIIFVLFFFRLGVIISICVRAPLRPFIEGSVEAGIQADKSVDHQQTEKDVLAKLTFFFFFSEFQGFMAYTYYYCGFG